MGCTITSLEFSKPNWVADINERPSRLRVLTLLPDRYQTSVLARVGRTPLILNLTLNVEVMISGQ
jgi:hypothetical protein